MPPPIARAARLRADLDRLAEVLASVGFGIASTDQDHRRDRRDRLVQTIRSYVVPRLGAPEAPLLVVVAGPTGSGKSTVVNSLAGHQVSKPGPLRPTTRVPVVWCGRRWVDRFASIGTIAAEVVPEDHPLLDDLAVVDTPDIDSYVTEHRRATVEILAHADVVVFVTSAQRYADAVPWDVLAQVDRRGAVLVHVLNRLGRRSAGAVADYAALLRSKGLEAEPIHTIQEQRVRGDAGALPSRTVRHVTDRLTGLASDRTAVLTEVTRHAVAYVLDEASRVADDVREQDQEVQRLSAIVDEVYRGAFEELVGELRRGTLIRSEVVERWSERVGTGPIARWVQGSASWMQGTLDRVSGRPAAVADDLEREARRELVEAVGGRLDRAARSVVTAWTVDEAGRAVVTEDLGVAGFDARPETEARIDAWLADLTRLVEYEAPGRFRTARLASTGVNAATVASLLAVFASTGGITGAEAGVAAGAAAAQQSILEHLLGRAAAGSLTGAARTSLIDSIQEVFSTEADRFHGVVAAASDPVERAGDIEEAAAVVETESETFHAG